MNNRNDYKSEYDQIIRFDKEIYSLQIKKNIDAKICMCIFCIIGFIFSIIPWYEFKAMHYVAILYVFIGFRNYCMYTFALKEDNKYVSIFSKIKYCPINIELYKKMKINKLLEVGFIVFFCISMIQLLSSLLNGYFSYKFFLKLAAVAGVIVISILINIFDYIKPFKKL